jgi:hypothetical protein
MREIFTSGTVGGALGNQCFYPEIYTPLSHLAHQIFQLWSNAVTNFSYFRKFHKLAFLFLIYGLSYISFSL